MRLSLIAPFAGAFLALALLSPIAVIVQISPVHAVNQSGVANWSAFGPQSRNMLITVYSDFQTMFNAFTGGQLDVTDWPIQPGDLSSFMANPDYYVSSPTSEFGIFLADINHHAPFLGMAQQTVRTTSPPSVSLVGTSAGCSIGTGRLIVNLKNLEEGGATILDPLNQLKATGPVLVSPVYDSKVNGTYVLPSPTTCMLAGNYTISTTVYAGSASIFLCPAPCSSGEIRTVNFNVNYNSPSTVKPTTAGINVERGLSHLIDKSAFLTVPSLGGHADYVDMQAPPSQGLNTGGAPNSQLPASILQEDCTGNNPSNAINPHPWVTSCNPASAYNLQAASIGAGSYWWALQGAQVGATAGYASLTDVRAACDHFVLAGFAISPANDTCLNVANAAAGTTPPPMPYPHLVPNGQVIMYIRTNAPRKAFGTILADSINFLFGTANNPSSGCTVNYGYLSPTGCTPVYYTITQAFDIVFGVASTAGVPPGTNAVDDWTIYTGGFSLGSTPDQLYSIYHSSFAGSLCGGVAVNYPGNYPIYCNPTYDAEAYAGEFSTSLAKANSFFANAAIIAYRTGMTIPVYSPIDQFAALNAWNFQPGTQSSLVPVLGHGFQQGFWTMLNMRCNPVTNAAASTVGKQCGGGLSGLIRRGFSQDVHKLSPFQALTVWDFEVISQVYDSMLAVNPLTGGTGQQVVDWMTTSHTSSFNQLEVSCVGTKCVTGTTTQKWYLRNDLKWQDGQSVVADDVVYTILAYRDVPSANLQPNVATVSSATTCGSNCVLVKLQNQSPFYEANIGGLPIIPKHIWAPICGIPPSPASSCGDPAFDPMAAGIFIGSGPWACYNTSTGAVGGPCTSSGAQDVTLGGTIVLKANDNYMRGPTNLQGSSLQKLSWADKNDAGIVNIYDIADAALHYGTQDPYWGHPLYSLTSGTVDIGDIATIAFYYDHGTTSPFSPSSLTGLDPQVDPFRTDLTSQGGPVVYYQGGLRTGSNQLSLQLMALSGAMNSTQFTATLKTDSGTLVGTNTGVAGSKANLALLNFSGVTAGAYQVQITFNGAAQPFTSIRLNLP